MSKNEDSQEKPPHGARREDDEPLEADSLSRPTGPPQPSGDDQADKIDGLSQRNQQAELTPPSAHVVLYQPEIPQNTGNIGRTCVAVDAKLWIVRPAAFRIDDARLRRAGLDYWQHLRLGDATNWDDLVEQLAPRRFFFFTRFATRSIWDAEFQAEDVFVFGRETAGLPETIIRPDDSRALRLPTSEHVRSLNLATTVGIVLYEQQRQLR